MSTYYIHPNTCSTGQAMCGLAMTGIYGIYNDVPDDMLPSSNLFPSEYLPILIELNGEEIYALKGTANWNESINGSGESTATFSYVGTTADRPEPYMSVKIGIGSMANLLWGGILLSFSEEYFGGNYNQGTLELKYTLNAVNYSHYFVRKVISYAGFASYSGEMIQNILSTYFSGKLTQGIIDQGIYHPYYTTKNEAVSSIIQTLAQEGELGVYITPEGVVHARELGTVEAHFNLTHEDGIDFQQEIDVLPINNFHNMKISEDASQIVTRLHLHASDYTKHETTYIHPEAIGDIELTTYDSLSSGSLRGKYKLYENDKVYYISPGQTTFYVDHPIGYIKSIDVLWINHYEEENTFSHYEWLDPLRGDFRIKGGPIYVGKGLHMALSQQHIYIHDNLNLEDNYGTLLFGDDESPLQPHSNVAWHWELRDEENGKDLLLAQEDTELDNPPFDWEISYDSNTISFNMPDINFGTNTGEIEFYSVMIEYYEQKDVIKTFNNTTRQAEIVALQGNDDGVIEQHVEYLQLASYHQWYQFKEAFFNLRSETLLSCSYSHIIHGILLLTQKLEPGMKQLLQVYGRNETLMIESVKYSIRAGAIPELTLDVSLATQQRDLSTLVRRMITGR